MKTEQLTQASAAIWEDRRAALEAYGTGKKTGRSLGLVLHEIGTFIFMSFEFGQNPLSVLRRYFPGVKWSYFKPGEGPQGLLDTESFVCKNDYVFLCGASGGLVGAKWSPCSGSRMCFSVSWATYNVSTRMARFEWDITSLKGFRFYIAYWDRDGGDANEIKHIAL